MSVVSIAKAENRYKTVFKSLKLIEENIEKGLKGKNKVLIKPNFVSVTRQLAATHVDAVRAIIDFIQKFKSKEIVVAEAASPYGGKTFEGYKNFGYLQLKDEYGIELIDLNEDDYEEISIFDRRFNEIQVKISRMLLESEYTISPAMLKTHNEVVATLSLKNIAVGAMIWRDKLKVHQGYQTTNLNLYKILEKIPIHLAVIDGWEGMEGEGPSSGEKVETKIALAGTDAVAVDTVGVAVMGINPAEIGYLQYCNGRLGEGDFKKIKIVGEKIENVKRKFKLHSEAGFQKNWKIPEERLKKLLD
jgi:uncharacterized protein (DUF362 family)